MRIASIAASTLTILLAVSPRAEAADGYIHEYRPAPCKGDFSGPVTDIQSIGLNWTGKFHDQTNKHVRDLEIEIDDQQKTMTITESGGGGNAPTQVWQGPYREHDGTYKMSGTLTSNGGKSPEGCDHSFKIDTNLPLP